MCSYIISKVLNQGNLTRITGITTKKGLERLAFETRLANERKLNKETSIMSTSLLKSEALKSGIDSLSD